LVWLRLRVRCAAPIDDEPLTEEDRQAVAEANKWLKKNPPISLESVLNELGLSMADWLLQSEEGDVKHLTGVVPPLYRLRTQDHRVFFQYLVVRMKDRKDAYL
jgi:hypothetical protein